jgi:hypothetical protein
VYLVHCPRRLLHLPGHRARRSSLLHNSSEARLQVPPTSSSSSLGSQGRRDLEVGARLGANDGDFVGLPVGVDVGLFDGETDGVNVGDGEGESVGMGSVGFAVGGGEVGMFEGVGVGAALVGTSVGETVGTTVGSLLLHRPHLFGQLLWTITLLQDASISSTTIRAHNSASRRP